MIPAASHAWRPIAHLPLGAWHPATRLLAAVLTVATAFLVPFPVVAVLALVLGRLLSVAGFRWMQVPRLVGAWWLVGGVVLVAHTISATDVAPLWSPSLVGLGRGGVVLVRLVLMLATIAVARRVLPLDDLIAAVGWCLGPLRRLGIDTRHLGLTMAVALGTAPQMQAEAERLHACLRLRRAPGRRGPWRALTERLRVVPPLMENLVRRAETLPLVLAPRVASASPAGSSPPWWQLCSLLVWFGYVAWTVFGGGTT